MKLTIQVATLFAVVLFAGVGLADNFVSEAPSEGTTPPSSPGSSTLEVKPPTGDGPKPLEFNLQGSSPEGQKAEGGLQNPQTGDDLQPNARTDLFRDES